MHVGRGVWRGRPVVVDYEDVHGRFWLDWGGVIAGAVGGAVVVVSGMERSVDVWEVNSVCSSVQRSSSHSRNRVTVGLDSGTALCVRSVVEEEE